MTVEQRFTRRASWVVAAVALLVAFAARPAIAQRFQDYFGGDSCQDEGFRGTAQLAGGGYIACGASNSTGVGTPCGPAHSYIVQTDASGALVWSRIFKVGFSDTATSIIEAANGDFVVCGIVHPQLNPVVSDIYVMRLSSTGQLLNGVTIDFGGNEEAWELLEATTGNAAVTNVGDIVLAGSTTMGAGAGRDALIIRLSATLGLVWESQWGGPGSNDDYLFGLDECTVGVPPVGMAGDIVAVGGTTSPVAMPRSVGNGDVLVLRVSGNTGAIGAPPQGAAAWGFDQQDEGFSIQELGAATTPGDLVLVGHTASRPYPAWNWEAFILQLTPDPTLPAVADLVYGDNGIGNDGALCVREDPFSTAPGGGVIVSGNTPLGYTIPLTTLAYQNAYLQRFAAATLLPWGGGVAFGGHYTDNAWSIGACTRISATETQGYILNGMVNGPLAPGGINPPLAQLFLVKTDNAFTPSSSCAENQFAFNQYGPLFVSQTQVFPIMNPGIPPIRATIDSTDTTWQNQICYALPVSRERGNGGNDGVSGVEGQDGAALAEHVLAVSPNPITGGSVLELRLSLASSARLTVTISDISGREMYRRTGNYLPGAAVDRVKTDTWPSGTYVVDVAGGGKHVTQTVVVVR